MIGGGGGGQDRGGGFSLYSFPPKVFENSVKPCNIQPAGNGEVHVNC